MKKIPVFVFETDSEQVSNDTYSMVACFINLGVHVPFTFEPHSKNECIQSVGEAISCDNSCESSHDHCNHGHMEDFALKRYRSHKIQEIVDRALSFTG